MTYSLKDLDFEPHSAGLGGQSAKIAFPNGYGASVLRGGPFYTTDGTYEIAVIHNGDIDYTTPITDDVLGYVPESEVERYLNEIAALPEKVDAA